MSNSIFVDFDGTIAQGHSGGFAMKKDPMPDDDNKIFIKNKIIEWLSKGHNVIIVTRGVDGQIHRYLDSLKIPHVMKSFTKGVLSVYAPDIATFTIRTTTKDKDAKAKYFANLKTKHVSDFLTKSGTQSKNSIFMDDTELNVTEMQKIFPDMTCITASNGD